MEKKVKIIRIEGARLKPRDSTVFFKRNRELWAKLKAGKAVSVPEELVKELAGIEIVKEDKPIVVKIEKKKEVIEDGNS